GVSRSLQHTRWICRIVPPGSPAEQSLGRPPRRPLPKSLWMKRERQPRKSRQLKRLLHRALAAAEARSRPSPPKQNPSSNPLSSLVRTRGLEVRFTNGTQESWFQQQERPR